MRLIARNRAVHLRVRPSAGTRNPRSIWLPAMALLSAAILSPSPGAEPVRFNRDIRPILADSCFSCHGPDRNQRKADLRLDAAPAASAPGETPAVVPGAPDRSELWHRVNSDDPELQMPPPGTRSRLTARQLQLVRRWIEEGAVWEDHWAWIPPKLPTPPAVQDAVWPRTPIDLFVRAKQEQGGLRHAPAAPLPALLRRIFLDLTGIPPSPEQLDACLADAPTEALPDVIERALDQALASPRYGERMGIRWLDGARYADTSGYQNDGPRDMWRWRDWVLESYNRDLAFDQFTIEQMAGDLLPEPTLRQRIATGFNRNHRGNAEGGIIPEEFAAEYVVDRVDTTATVWLGLTIGCARCHEHKFDPISHREFYQLFAYFNNVPEQGRAIKEGNSPPYIVAPTDHEFAAQREWLRRLDEAESRAAEAAPLLALRQQEWEARHKAGREPSERPIIDDWNVDDGLHLRLDCDQPAVIAASGWKAESLRGDSQAEWRTAEGICGNALALTGETVFVLASSTTPSESPAARAPGLAAQRLPGDFGYFDRFSISVWVNATDNRLGTVVSKMADAPDGDGWSLRWSQGKLQVNFVKRWLDDALRLETTDSLSTGEWHHVGVVYDGTRVANGVTIYVDGIPREKKVLLDGLNQSFANKEPLRVGGGGGPDYGMRGQIDEIRLFDRNLDPREMAMLANAAPLSRIAATPAPQRGAAEHARLTEYFLTRIAAPDDVAPWRRHVALRREFDAFQRALPTVMVMEEMPVPRATHILLRGEYDKPGERVSPAIPAMFGGAAGEFPPDRLGLARWLVRPDNPLTSRVAVNRIWQMLFGAGIVRTVEDFGTQGDTPSHPELLDWLAVTFARTGGNGSAEAADGEPRWSQKLLLRRLLLSASYLQSSAIDPAAHGADPANRLLSRGPRFRLSAEMIRDQALSVADLLVESIGGRSVKPYQPADLWKELATDNEYRTDTGGGLFRRGIYTYWKRTVAPPNMMTFDAAARETCVVREVRTNTPLQALTLLNEITFVEAARNLAAAVVREPGTSPEHAIALAFRRATCRQPSATELRTLVDGFQRFHRHFSGDAAAALELVKLGESPLPSKFDLPELAAMTATCNLILNLDEVITRH